VGFSDQELHGSEQVVLRLRPHWWFFVRQIAALLGAMAVAIVVLVFDAHSVLKWVAIAALLAALLFFGLRYLRWTTTWFVITTDRIIRRRGVLHRQGIEIPLERINTVFFSQTLFQRVISAGNLEIESASEEGSQQVENIRKPLNVQNEIYRQMEDNENRKYNRMAQSLGSVDAIPDRPSVRRTPEAAAPTQFVAPVPNSDHGGMTQRMPTSTAQPPASTPTEGARAGEGRKGTKGSHTSIPEQIEQLARLHANGILTEAEFQAKKSELLDRM